jgi:hypothetical protein
MSERWRKSGCRATDLGYDRLALRPIVESKLGVELALLDSPPVALSVIVTTIIQTGRVIFVLSACALELAISPHDRMNAIAAFI